MIGHDELMCLDMALELAADALDGTEPYTPEQGEALAAELCKVRACVREALFAYRDEEVTS